MTDIYALAALWLGLALGARHPAEQIVRYAEAHRIDHIVAGLPLSLEIVAGERQAEAKLEFASQFKREAIVAIGNGRNAEPSGGSTCSNG